MPAVVSATGKEQEPTNPKVSVIGVLYNSRDVIETLLQSLLQQTYRNTEIILVDNGSSDGSSNYVTQNYSSVRVLKARKTWDMGVEQTSV
jgi:glycosyltransferase involved in cell wall biosynthesis